MKPRNLYITILILTLLAALSCNQDPIFYIISKETAPLKPLIEGTPTNMVIFNRMYPNPDYPDLTEPGYPDPNVPGHFKSVPILYVASGNRLYWYAKSNLGEGESAWNSGEYKIPQPGGMISGLAATSTHLYALCRNSSNLNTVLRRIGPTPSHTNWEVIPSSDSHLQTIFADPAQDRLFAGTINSILFLTSNSSLQLLKDLSPMISVEQISMLSGVIYDEVNDLYLLSTGRSGIFQVLTSDLSTADLAGGIPDPLAVQQLTETNNPNENNNNRIIAGMIKLESNPAAFFAIERVGGYFYTIDADAGTFSRIEYTGDLTGWMATGKDATGAIALWKDYLNPDTQLVVFGVQDPSTTSYAHGYVEFKLNSDGSLNTGSARHDPGKLISVLDNDRYSATIGKYPINHLFQAPDTIDDEMTFFASTQNSGLWSYRNRVGSGGWQWNAEN